MATTASDGNGGGISIGNDGVNINTNQAVIPFSAHSKRTIRRNSLFPTTEKQRAEEINKLEMQDVDFYAKANAIVKIGGKGLPTDPGLWLELQQIAEEEKLKNYDRLHNTTGMLIPSTRDEVVSEQENNRITKLRHLKDRASHFLKIRREVLAKLKNQYFIREQEDKMTIDVTMEGMMQLESLQLKFMDLTTMIQQESQIQAGYTQLNEICTLTNPNDKFYLNEIQGYVELARKQLIDLVHCRRQTYDDAEKIRNLKVKQYENKIAYYTDARKQLKSKRQAFLIKYHLLEEEEERYAKSQQGDDEDEYSSDGDGTNSLTGTGAAGGAGGSGSGSNTGGNKKGKKKDRRTSMSAIKNALTKSLERVKRKNDVQIVSMKNEETAANNINNISGNAFTDDLLLLTTTGGSGVGISGSGNMMLTSKELEYLVDSNHLKYFDSGRMIQEVALMMGSGSGNNSYGNNNTNNTHHHTHHNHNNNHIFNNADHKLLLHKLTDKNSKEYKEIASKIILEFVLEKTYSRTEDDLIERYNTSKGLSEVLFASQVAADERVSRLKKEYEDLHASMGSFGLSLLNNNGNGSSSSLATGGNGSTDNDDTNGSSGEGSSAKNNHNNNSNDDDDGIDGNYFGSDSNNKNNSIKEVVAMTEIDNENKSSSSSHQNDSNHNHNGNNNTNSGGHANGEEQVFLDENQLLERERKLHQIEFCVEKNATLINEAKIGIKHVLNTIGVNTKLLHQLPKSTVPPIEKDSDISNCLIWIEEKLVAITEAMALDEGLVVPTAANANNNKNANGTDSSATGQNSNTSNRTADPTHYKSFPERQQDLAILVQGMLNLGLPANDPTTNERKMPRRNSVYATPDEWEMGKTFISAKPFVMIKPSGEVDDVFNANMKKITLHKDKEAIAAEQAKENEVSMAKPKNVHKFLDDALASTESRNMLHQAKKLSRQLRGAHSLSAGSYGYTIETILKANSLETTSINAKRKQEKLKKEAVTGGSSGGNHSAGSVTSGGSTKSISAMDNKKSGTSTLNKVVVASTTTGTNKKLTAINNNNNINNTNNKKDKRLSLAEQLQQQEADELSGQHGSDDEHD